MTNTHLGALLIGLLIAITIGGVLLGSVTDVDVQKQQMHDRANETYQNVTTAPSSTGGSVMLAVPVPEEWSHYNATERVEKHLYVTGYAYTVSGLGDVTHLSKDRVKDALQRLEQRGVVSEGYVSDGFLPWKHWQHTNYGDLPKHWWSPYASVFPLALGTIIGGTGLVYLYNRYKRGKNNE